MIAKCLGKRAWIFWLMIGIPVPAISAYSLIKYQQRKRVKDCVVNHGGLVHFFYDGPSYLEEIAGETIGIAFGRVQVTFPGHLTGRKTAPAPFVQCLSKLGHVDTLALSGSSIDDQWLKLLSQETGVAILIIEASSISDQGLRFLADIEGLEIVKLADNPQVTPKGIAQIEKELPNVDFLVSSD